MHKIICAIKTPNGTAAILLNSDTNEQLFTFGQSIVSGKFGYIKKLGLYILIPNNDIYIFTKKCVTIKRIQSDSPIEIEDNTLKYTLYNVSMEIKIASLYSYYKC